MTLLHTLSTAELIFLPMVGIAVGVWLLVAWTVVRGSRGKVGPLADRLDVTKRIENLEYVTSDLQGRFNRFQKREGMREARSAIDLNREAAEVLAADAASSAAPISQPSVSDTHQQRWFKPSKRT